MDVKVILLLQTTLNNSISLKGCGIHEHNIPVYFTRFFQGKLPYSTDGILCFETDLIFFFSKDVKKILEQQKKFKRVAKYPSSVLICPSVGDLSFLANDFVIDALVEAQVRVHFIVTVFNSFWNRLNSISSSWLNCTDIVFFQTITH